MALGVFFAGPGAQELGSRRQRHCRTRAASVPFSLGPTRRASGLNGVPPPVLSYHWHARRVKSTGRMVGLGPCQPSSGTNGQLIRRGPLRQASELGPLAGGPRVQRGSSQQQHVSGLATHPIRCVMFHRLGGGGILLHPARNPRPIDKLSRPPRLGERRSAVQRST
jgi:hypothetical protein